MSAKRLNLGRLVASLFKYLLLAALGIFILILLLLSSAYGDLKNAGTSGLSGKNALTVALGAVKAQNWSQAASLAAQAQDDFERSLNSLRASRDNQVVKYFPPVKRQVDDLEYLLSTAEILNRSLIRILPLAESLDSVRAGSLSHDFSGLSPEAKNDFLRLIYEAEPELSGLRANLKLALMNLDKIHRLGILWPVYNQISDIKEELRQVSYLFDKLAPLVKLLPVLTGYPQESRFLIIMQNNDELRPSGGFIGVYGLLNIKSGEIGRLETHDSYHLDMPASLSDDWRLEPPEILQKYLKTGKWYLRDANWSPDWAQSSRRISYVYNGISQATGKEPLAFTGLIGLTPDLVADLIALVGPIKVREETYTPENFQPLLQYNVEIAYREQDISQWDRKNVVGEIMDEIKERLFKLPSGKWLDLLHIVERSIATRDLQIYFSADHWQKLARELGADGELKNPDGDFLMVVDANLAAFKSDAVVNKGIDYQVSEKDGFLEAKLKLSYRHEGGFDWRTTRYQSYTRVYAPLGSEFLSLEEQGGKIADQSAVSDTTLNKEVFAFFLTLEPGHTAEFNLRYRLPDNIYQDWLAGDYTLLAQKQAGRRTEELRVEFKPESGQALSWTSDFLTDKNFWFDK